MKEAEVLEILKPGKYFKLVSDGNFYIMFGICKKIEIVQADKNLKVLYIDYLGKIALPLDSNNYILISDGIAINCIKYVVIGDSEEEVENNALLMEEIYG